MIGILVWAVAIAGMGISVVQMITARRLDLKPLVLGSLALVAVLGLLDVVFHLAAAYRLVALGSTPDPMPPVAQHLSAAVHGVLALAVGVGGVSGLGGLAIFLRDVQSQRAETARVAEPPASPAPSA